MRDFIERNERVTFHVSLEEKQFIEKNAAKEDMSVSNYCRKYLVKKMKEEVENDRDRVQNE